MAGGMIQGGERAVAEGRKGRFRAGIPPPELSRFMGEAGDLSADVLRLMRAGREELGHVPGQNSGVGSLVLAEMDRAIGELEPASRSRVGSSCSR